jgi:CDP-2,3-bis-(O-geranylgeranyl)-sn-glycerol synthase
VQKLIYSHSNLYLPLNYNQINFWLLGSLLGAGALIGDAAESFIKRQLNIPEGERFLIFDQIDYIVGGLLLSSFYISLTISQYFYIASLYFLLHLIVNFAGFKLGLRAKPL